MQLGTKPVGKRKQRLYGCAKDVFFIIVPAPITTGEIFKTASDLYGHTVKQVQKALYLLLDNKDIAKCEYCYRWHVNWTKKGYSTCDECEINIQSQVSS